MLDAKLAPASMGGVTRETFNYILPKPEVNKLGTGALANIAARMTTARDRLLKNIIIPRGTKSCLGNVSPLGKPSAPSAPGSVPAVANPSAPTSSSAAASPSTSTSDPAATNLPTPTSDPEAAAPADEPTCTDPVGRGSHVDNLRWNYVHTGVDYAVGDTRACAIAGCTTGAANLPGQMKHLEIKRIHRPMFAWQRSSFGLGVFSAFDASLQLVQGDYQNPTEVLFYDPETDSDVVPFTETVSGSGILYDLNTRIEKSVELFTSSGAHASSISNAVAAIVTAHTGEKWKFDIIFVDGVRKGRLTQKLDRSGNAETVTYLFPATASDATLSNDRSQLWKIQSIKDPYGATANLSYTRAGGWWSISGITLPNSTSLTYSYDSTVPIGTMSLTSVRYSDGSVSTFSTSIDTTYNEVVLHIDDSAAGEDQRQSVFLTESTWQGIGQQPNVVRRVTNGIGEIIYRNWEDPTIENLFYIYDAPGKLTRIQTVTCGCNYGFPSQVAYATTVADPRNVQPASSYSYEVAETYQMDAVSSMTSRTRADGTITSFTRDPVTRAILDVTYPGNIKPTASYNAFREPTSLKDTLGISHTLAYDSKGNITTATVASGTSAQSIWGAAYNSRGQPSTVTSARGFVISYAYDSIGNLTSITDPPDASGGTAPVQTYTYDAASGRVTSFKDGSLHTTSYSYDTRGRLNKITYPDGTSDTYAYNTSGLLSQYTDRIGSRTTYQYDGTNRLQFKAAAAGTPAEQDTSYKYAPGAHIVAIQGVGGLTTSSYTYDSRNRIVTATVPVKSNVSLSRTIVWDPFDRKLVQSDIEGFRTFFVYDTNDRVMRTVRELGHLSTSTPPFTMSQLPTLARDTTPNPRWAIDDFQVDKTGHVVQTTDPRGTVTTYGYDQQGRLIQQVDASGTTVAATTKISYDADGNATKVIRPRTFTAEGNGSDSFREEFTYNQRDLLLKVTEGAGKTEAKVTHQFTYTPTRRKAADVDGNGKTTTYKYDVNDRLSEVDDQAGFATKYTYDGNGNVFSITDANSHKTSFQYDGRNRLTQKTNAALEIERTTYDDNMTDSVGISGQSIGANLGFFLTAQGRAIVTTDATGVTTVAIYDSLDRVVRRGQYNPPLSRLTTTSYEYGTLTVTNPSTYDLRVEGTIEGTGGVMLAAKDANGAVRQITDQEHQITTLHVDAVGNRLKLRNATGVGADWVYDARGRVISVTDTQSSNSLTAYDVENNVKTTTNPLNNYKTFTYDARGQKVTEVDERGKKTIYSYDGTRHVASVTDAESRVTQYQYEPRGLLTKQIYSDGGADNMTYDNVGMLKSKTNQLNQVTTFGYDAVNRFVSRAYPDGQTDSLTYDHASRPANAVSGRYNNTVKRAYNAIGQLMDETVIANGLTLVTHYAYDLDGNPTQITYPNGSIVTQTYNFRDQLVKTILDGTTVATYVRDQAGRPTGIGFGNGTTETITYRMDDLPSSYLLTQGAVTKFSLTYVYDANKRKTAETNNLTPTESQTFTYDAADRLTNWSQGANSQNWTLTDAGDWQSTTRNGIGESRTHGTAHEINTVKVGSTATLVTDAHGRITTDDKGRTYTWDFDDQLKSTTASGTTISYTWDARGRRLSKVVGGTTTLFINQGDRTDARPLTEYDNGSFARLYIYGGEQRDEVLMMKAGSNKYYFAHGAQESVQLVTDGTGNVAEKYRYDASGLQTVLSPSGSTLASTAIANRIGFTGRYHDESGLIAFRTRSYQPRLGRFISRDDAFYDGPNLYRAYFLPNRLDPSGQCGWRDPWNCAADVAKATYNDVIVPAATSSAGRFVIETGLTIVIQAGVQAVLPGPAGVIVGGFVAGAVTSYVDRGLKEGFDNISLKEGLTDVVVGGAVGAAIGATRAYGVNQLFGFKPGEEGALSWGGSVLDSLKLQVGLRASKALYNHEAHGDAVMGSQKPLVSSGCI